MISDDPLGPALARVIRFLDTAGLLSIILSGPDLSKAQPSFRDGAAMRRAIAVEGEDFDISGEFLTLGQAVAAESAGALAPIRDAICSGQFFDEEAVERLHGAVNARLRALLPWNNAACAAQRFNGQGWTAHILIERPPIGDSRSAHERLEARMLDGPLGDWARRVTDNTAA